MRWCPGTGSNRRHCDFQSHALPTELPGPTSRRSGRPDRRSERVPSFRPRRCPARASPRPASAGGPGNAIALAEPFAAGRGPCSRGCRTAHARALAACRTAGQGLVDGFGMAAGHGERRVGAQGHRSADLPRQPVEPVGPRFEHGDDRRMGGQPDRADLRAPRGAAAPAPRTPRGRPPARTARRGRAAARPGRSRSR